MATPIAQIRVIAGERHATALIGELLDHARAVIGPHAVYRTRTCAAARTGYVRIYLTITPEGRTTHE